MQQLQELSLFENHWNGTIPPFVYNMKQLQILSLKDVGSNMRYLDVSQNNLSGNIPTSLGVLISLEVLKLNNNNFDGEILNSLQNCSQLTGIDLGDNKLFGKISQWIGGLNVSMLNMIRLRSNKFSGHISQQLCNLQQLHILDLSHNNISGTIPKCLGNLASLVNDSYTSFDTSYDSDEQTTLTLKGRELVYNNTIYLVKSIDLSSNTLQGEVPEEISSLILLGTLNLSRNQLTGKIPSEIENLHWLETFDLSHNHLSGQISQSVSSLTSLSHLNLSYNNLFGRIPSGNQLQTLIDPSIYMENPSLCGVPLSTKCPGDDTFPSKDTKDMNEGENDELWFYISMVLGFIVGFWGVCGTLILKTSWRVSVGTNVKTVNLSSRISFLVRMLNPSMHFPSIKELKAPSESQGTKAMGLNREPIVTDGRKSLPVLKVNPEEASIPKENAGRNSEGKRGYYVVPRVNDTTRSHLLRNRVSDIFVIMGQRNSNVRVLPRNSVRSTLSTLKVRESQRTLKSKGASRPNKLVSATATSSKTEKVATSLPENVKHEATQGELPSEANCSQSASTIISRRKSNRRTSYTSLLMTGSKIYQYYWVSEAQNPPPENFMSIQAGITHHMRGILVNWLIELAIPLICSSGTGTLQIRVNARNSLMVTLLDQHLSQVTIKKDDMQLVGITALLLASKYEDFWHPREKAFLKKLKFRLNAPTPYVFMLRFLKAAQSETKVFIANRLLLCGLFCSLNTWFYLIELCLVEYEALRFKPSLLCAAALSVARCTQQITPAWTLLVTKYPKSGTALKTNCAEMVLRFHKAARVGNLKVTYEKYSSPDLSGVCSNKTIGDASTPIQLRGVEIRMLTIQEIKTSASSSRLVFPFIC
ncbi:LRR receptor-like serine/threonine-protein kinase GSO1 [Pyrus ussuriensis x Pyrus communis]|uniref:B-like cyclin n=1 Tax=Pyrus ussuriensis x Pyrus communis TaxID=2448454 RepID=A0A5N5IHK5_9ROSA|nr:LRR receptor-like serine/threonine-protein kinase GSO1 [Pyrus ussuriensis x Pyrus communis]